MTDMQALRNNAIEATGGSWVRESGEGWEAICCDDDQGNAGFIIAEFQGKDAAANRKFVQSANPFIVLVLLDELEGGAGRIKELESQRAMAFTACNRWRDKFKEAEKRIAELEASHAQVMNARDHYKRVASEGIQGIAESRTLTVKLRKYSVSEVMLITGFDRQYAEGWCAGNDNAIHEVRAAGITLDTGE